MFGNCSATGDILLNGNATTTDGLQTIFLKEAI